MLSYRPDGALSPRLARIMKLLSKEIIKDDLMASVMITDGVHGEFFLGVDPDWSCCTMSRIPGGDISVKVRSHHSDYKNLEEQKEHLGRTINGLAMLYKMGTDNTASLMAILSALKKSISFEHSDEEETSHGADLPDPDKVPATLEEAAELIHATLDADMLAWVKKTPLHTALPVIHHGFGRELRNSWILHEKDTPLKGHIRERLGLWGHGDDATVLIFTALWGRVGGEPAEVIEASLQLEAEEMKRHWQEVGVNPQTGGQIFIP